jgi:3-oxoacyl-[acyl-carrier-protein] synthase II
MAERVAITGISCISCFGTGHAALMAGLNAGRSGLAPIGRFDTKGCHSHCAVVIRDFDPTEFIPPMKLRRVDAVGRIALAATRMLMNDSSCTPRPEGAENIGIALGTATAGLDSLVEYLGDLTDRGPTGVPAILFSNTVSNAPASLCAIELGLRGPNVTFNQREASSASALVFAVGAIRDGRAAAMVSGGADYVEETLFKVYDRFRALSPMRAAQAADEAARPYDLWRNGFVLGEGGYLLLLESASVAATRGARIYGEIVGVGAAASKTALNQWPSNGRALAQAMRTALTDAALSCDDIAAVIGTADGSPILDRLEAEAILDVFGDRTVPVASIKGALGESGAAGAAGLIAGLLSVQNSSLVPTVGLVERDSNLGVSVSGAAQHTVGTTFLLNSVASGGTHYTVVVRAGQD